MKNLTYEQVDGNNWTNEDVREKLSNLVFKQGNGRLTIHEVRQILFIKDDMSSCYGGCNQNCENCDRY